MNVSPFGLLFFPMTPFRLDQSLNLSVLEEHLEEGLAFDPGGVFVACGAGEFHSLSEKEIHSIIELAVRVTNGRTPVYVGVGGQIQVAKELAKAAGDFGADGLLVFPPYMVSASSEGLIRYFAEMNAVTRVPFIAYNRPGVLLTEPIILQILDLEHLMSIKDGMGDLTQISEFMSLVAGWETSNPGQRKISFLNGTPTAELNAVEFRNIGITSYSSAVLSFAPEIASLFYKSLVAHDDLTVNELLTNFYIPLSRIRDEIEGGAISIIKAGARIRGSDCGGVRAPLLDFNGDQTMRLRELIERGSQIVGSRS